MNITNEYGMNPLLAQCPNCDKESLYCGKIPTSIRAMINKEVLFCKTCKFVTSVDEFKKLLFSV